VRGRGEQDAVPIQSCGAFSHPVPLLETLDRFLLGTSSHEVLHEARHAQEWMLCDATREVPVSGCEQPSGECHIHPIAVHQVLSGHRHERKGMR
jgi:hypothetical protein